MGRGCSRYHPNWRICARLTAVHGANRPPLGLSFKGPLMRVIPCAPVRPELHHEFRLSLRQRAYASRVFAFDIAPMITVFLRFVKGQNHFVRLCALAIAICFGYNGRYPYDMDLRSGRYVVDAKSILGIFSIDLSKPILMSIYSDDCDDLLKALEPYIVKDEAEQS